MTETVLALSNKVVLWLGAILVGIVSGTIGWLIKMVLNLRQKQTTLIAEVKAEKEARGKLEDRMENFEKSQIQMTKDLAEVNAGVKLLIKFHEKD